MSQIGLLDCNNFFVSCERLFRPDLEGKPVAVLSSNDGCIVARSQEVKDLGIAMGVPHFQIKDLCKNENITLFSGNLTLYRDISARVMQILTQEVGRCEIYSIDEAFFVLPDDVQEGDLHHIRDVVMRKVGIPVSVGGSVTKTLAKLASGIGKKKEGFYMLTQEDWIDRSKDVRCGEIWGLGRQTTAKLSEMGIKSAADFMALTHADLRQNFGVATERIYSELHGKPVLAVGENSESVRQSIASTRSFADTTMLLEDLESAVAQHVTHVAQKLRERQLLTSKMHVYIQTSRFGDFFMQGNAAEIILNEPSASTAQLLKLALSEVRSMYVKGVPYKKAGVSVSGLMPESYITQDLFSEKAPETGSKIDDLTDLINKKFGRGSLRSAAILDNRAKSKAQLRSAQYTTSWKDIPIVIAK